MTKFQTAPNQKVVRTDIMEEKVKVLKEQIYARLRGETPKVQVQLGGRSSGNMYALLLALDSCLMELYEENQALLSNQESINEKGI